MSYKSLLGTAAEYNNVELAKARHLIQQLTRDKQKLKAPNRNLVVELELEHT